MSGRRRLRTVWPALLVTSATLAGGCGLLSRDALPVPTAEEARTFFAEHGGLAGVEVSGNLVEVRIRQPAAQLRRGGSLWAKVGPYIYLFSPNTRDLFRAYEGAAAVRVVVLVGADVEVARATLHRETLTDVLWRRSLNILGHALQEGTQRPSRLEELVTWGERHAEFRYNPDFIPE